MNPPAPMGEGVCWSILAVLVVIAGLLIRNGWVMEKVDRMIAVAITLEMSHMDDWRCKFTREEEKADATKGTKGQS